MLTAMQIIQRACAVAKAPGYTVQCGQYLNSLLDDLQQTYDFDYIRKTIILPIAAGSNGYTLPEDYLRAREVFYSVNGTIFFLDQMALELYDQLFQGSGITNYPTKFATDIAQSPPVMYFYQPPAQSFQVTVRYQPRKDDIVNPQSSSEVPWFKDSRYLITKLAADLMQETDDARQDRYFQRAAEMLSKIMSMDDDDEGYARNVKLDPLLFKGGGARKATKNQPL